MKAILEFKLPEEDSDFFIAQNGLKVANELKAFEHYLRNISKYGCIDGVLIAKMDPQTLADKIHKECLERFSTLFFD